MIRIRSKKDGFRRCGIAHSSAPKDYPDDRFTKEQIKALKAEPMLFVEELPDPQKPDPEKGLRPRAVSDPEGKEKK